MSKKLGQNFLKNHEIADKIVNMHDLQNKVIYEIGCGKGFLTNKILKKKPKHLFGIEIDEKLCEQISIKNKNFTLLKKDALLFEWENIKSKPFIIGNLPYSTSCHIILSILKNALYEKCIFMVQKEVAHRIVSKENCKEYGRLSVMCQASSFVKIEIDNIPPSYFTPSPKVYSSVLSFIPKKFFFNWEHLSQKTKILFSHRRKKLSYVNKKFNINLPCKYLSKRAENLKVEEFLSL